LLKPPEPEPPPENISAFPLPASSITFLAGRLNVIFLFDASSSSPPGSWIWTRCSRCLRRKSKAALALSLSERSSTSARVYLMYLRGRVSLPGVRPLSEVLPSSEVRPLRGWNRGRSGLRGTENPSESLTRKMLSRPRKFEVLKIITILANFRWKQNLF
jgi:hypothetical protein